MKGIVPILLLVLLAVLLFWAIGCYNRLQALRAVALQSLAQHVGSIQVRNAAIQIICKALSGNLQHERAAFSEADAALHRNTALAEAAVTARGSNDALHAFAHSEHELAHHVQTLRDINDIYPELSVNAQLVDEWNALHAALARCRFCAEQLNANASRLNDALHEKPARHLASTMKLHTMAALPVQEMLLPPATAQPGLL